jgi:hypothetical protein
MIVDNLMRAYKIAHLLELLCVDVAVPVSVEDLEGFLELGRVVLVLCLFLHHFYRIWGGCTFL